MRKSRFTDSQIMDALRRVEAGIEAQVALKHGINPNQLHIWRRARLGDGTRAVGSEPRLVPMVLEEAVDCHHESARLSKHAKGQA